MPELERVNRKYKNGLVRGLKSKFIRQFEFSENLEDLYGKIIMLLESKALFSSNLKSFSIQIFLFFKKLDCHKFSFFNDGDSNLAILVFLMLSFHFRHSSSHSP